MLQLSKAPEALQLDTEEKVGNFAERLEKESIFALDTETTGTDTQKDTPIYLSIAFDDVRAALPIILVDKIRPILQDPNRISVFHNAKFDLHMLDKVGIFIPNVHDTLVMAVMENTERPFYDLKYLVKSVFRPEDPGYVSYESPFKAKDKIRNIIDAERVYGKEFVYDYSALDAWSDWHLYKRLRKKLDAEHAAGVCTLWDLYLMEEVPYTQVLYEMEKRGFLLDFDSLRNSSVLAKKEIEILAMKFCAMAGRVINPASIPQLRDLFFNQLKRKSSKSTKKGGDSLDDEVISQWAADGDPLASVLQEFRKVSKLNSTYLDGLINCADVYGRVHTTFKQGGAATGRLSSADPNLQNIPRPDTDKFKVRSAFVASPGMKIIDADYDQLEMCLIADLAGEKNMMEALASGKDLHSTTVNEMYGVPYEKVVAAKKKSPKEATEEEAHLVHLRYEAKTIGFMLNYGGGPQKLSSELGCTFEEAKEKIAKYFAVRPGLKKFAADCSQFAEGSGYISTISGRRRHFSAMSSPDARMVHGASRKAGNSCIQGSAADVVRLAMIYCHRDDFLRSLGVALLSQVHDELIFECPEENVEKAMPRIKELMELPYKNMLEVKITTNPSYGDNWLEAKG